MPRFGWRVFLGCGLSLLLLLPAHGQTSGATTLPVISRTLTFENQTVVIDIVPSLSLDFADGAAVLHLDARGSLGDLVAKMPDALRHLADRKSKCTQRWSFPSLDPPAIVDGRMKVAGKVRVELWTCGVVKTRLARETADFVLAVRPEHAPDRITIKAEIERFDLGQSLLGSLGLEEAVRDALRDALQSALGGDAASIGFPEAVMPFGPTFTGARLSSEQGTPEMIVSATARPSAADATALLTKLLTERGR